MREILFKAKRISDGEWVEGSLVYVPEDANFMPGAYILPRLVSARADPPTKGIMLGGFFEVDPSTVCEYTGLTDKNGKKIFEHDVVIVRDEGGEIYCFSVAFGKCGGIQNVDHDVGYMGFYFEPNNEETKCCMEYGARNDMIYYLNAYKCEAIGNIHDGEDGQ